MHVMDKLCFQIHNVISLLNLINSTSKSKVLTRVKLHNRVKVSVMV